MRALLAIALLAGLAAAVPSASAYLTTPKELCHPGEYGVCHWAWDDGQCAMVHFGTMWVGVCQTGDAGQPVRVCSTLVTPFWDGWCPQDGNALGDLLGY